MKFWGKFNQPERTEQELAIEDKRVRAIIAPLSTHKQFQAFYDNEIDGKTLEEIGEKMDISHQAVSKLKHRVIKKLRKQLGGLQKRPYSEKAYSHTSHISAEGGLLIAP